MSKTSSQVASSLLLPDGWAYLDWITGMIRIDSNRTDWERLKEKVPPNKRLTAHMLTEDELTLLETFTHEMVHYLQLCTTGYLYRLARDLLAVLAELPPASTIDDVPEADLTRAAGRLRAIKEERLCAPGKRGLAVISLVESAAFLVQKRTHYDLTPADYEAALVGWPAMYRAGYDIAREHLGDEA